MSEYVDITITVKQDLIDNLPAIAGILDVIELEKVTDEQATTFQNFCQQIFDSTTVPCPYSDEIGLTIIASQAAEQAREIVFEQVLKAIGVIPKDAE